jgi:hypothetical protein
MLCGEKEGINLIILAHRGLWIDPSQKNTRAAFQAAFLQGFGLETDIRDQDGRLVISHDPPTGDTMSFEDLLALYGKYGRPGQLAINIKADGLSRLVSEALDARGITNAFVFDMSVPDALHYCRLGSVPVFTRQSEFEMEPSLYDRAAGVWLDAFERDWINSEVIRRHRLGGKKVALVSPELHGRTHEAQWREWAGYAKDPGVMICTDFPVHAREVFQ